MSVGPDCNAFGWSSPAITDFMVRPGTRVQGGRLGKYVTQAGRGPGAAQAPVGSRGDGPSQEVRGAKPLPKNDLRVVHMESGVACGENGQSGLSCYHSPFAPQKLTLLTE